MCYQNHRDLSVQTIDMKVLAVTLLIMAPYIMIGDAIAPIPKGCSCPTIYDPVCSSDGVTYPHSCVFDWENKRRTSLRLPLLKSSPEECACDCNTKPSQFKPVCGSDGNTYFSKCTFNCENLWRMKHGKFILMIRNNGVCCDCSNKRDLLCGSDNRTYRNGCWLKCENVARAKFNLPQIRVVHRGAC